LSILRRLGAIRTEIWPRTVEARVRSGGWRERPAL